jgi:hypothetical protein
MSASIDTELLSDTGPKARPPQPPPPRINRLFDRILVIGFLMAISVPFAGTWLHWDRAGDLKEKRVLAPLPALPHTFKEATNYSDNFFAFFTDHFGFRKALIHDFQDARFRAGMITSNDRAIAGKDGWLFLRLGGGMGPNPGFNLERGLLPFTEPQLNEWQNMLERRAAYFKSKGIVYLFVIAPDKQSIYPEYMPDDLAPRGPSRIDQLADRMAKTHTPVNFIDLRPALLAAKSSQQIYRKTDTHWSDEGAWVGYQQLMVEIRWHLANFHIEAQPRSDFHVVDRGMISADLVPMLGLDNQIQEHWLSLVRNQEFVQTRGGVPNQGSLEYDLHDPALPRLVMYHDSFTQLLLPMLGPHFGHADFTFNHVIQAATIDAQKPNIVISEMVERNLYLPPPMDSPEIRGAPILTGR